MHTYFFCIFRKEKDFENQKKYLLEYNQLENKYTKAMFTVGQIQLISYGLNNLIKLLKLWII